MFCSWGAEEYGLVGSYEWVEVKSLILISNKIDVIRIMANNKIAMKIQCEIVLEFAVLQELCEDSG